MLHRGGVETSTTDRYRSHEWQDHHNTPVNLWHTFSGIIRVHEVMASIEKPIVCQVNGDLIGGQCHLALASDLIVAREDALFVDHHLAMGQWSPPARPSVSCPVMAAWPSSRSTSRRPWRRSS